MDGDVWEYCAYIVVLITLSRIRLVQRFSVANKVAVPILVVDACAAFLRFWTTLDSSLLDTDIYATVSSAFSYHVLLACCSVPAASFYAFRGSG